MVEIYIRSKSTKDDLYMGEIQMQFWDVIYVHLHTDFLLAFNLVFLRKDTWFKKSWLSKLLIKKKCWIRCKENIENIELRWISLHCLLFSLSFLQSQQKYYKNNDKKRILFVKLQWSDFYIVDQACSRNSWRCYERKYTKWWR